MPIKLPEALELIVEIFIKIPPLTFRKVYEPENEYSVKVVVQVGTLITTFLGNIIHLVFLYC